MIRSLAVLMASVTLGSMVAGGVVFWASWRKTRKTFDLWQVYTAAVASVMLGRITWLLATDSTLHPLFWLIVLVLLNVGIAGITLEKEKS